MKKLIALALSLALRGRLAARLLRRGLLFRC